MAQGNRKTDGDRGEKEPRRTAIEAKMKTEKGIQARYRKRGGDDRHTALTGSSKVEGNIISFRYDGPIGLEHN